MSSVVYSDREQQEIREFFNSDVPAFPFNLRAKPLSSINVSNRRQVVKLAKEMARHTLMPSVIDFIKNISKKPQLNNLSDFETEITSSHSYFCLLHIIDIASKTFEQNLVAHTKQYIQVLGFLDEDDSNDVYSKVIFLPKIQPITSNAFGGYGDFQHIMDFINQSESHTVVVEERNGNDLHFLMTDVLSYKRVSDGELKTFISNQIKGSADALAG